MGVKKAAEEETTGGCEYAFSFVVKKYKGGESAYKARLVGDP